MNNEFLRVLEYIEKEKGVDREVIIEAVEASLVSAARKSLQHVKNADIDIDRKTGEIKVYNTKVVVEGTPEPGNEEDEIALKEARKAEPEIQVGDTFNVLVSAPSDFGRIAAQTAKQVIIHRIKEAEKSAIFDDFKDREGELITGTIRRIERNNFYIDLGKTEAVLSSRDICHPTDDEYRIHDRIRTYVKEVKLSSKGPAISLTRTSTKFIQKLLEMEVPELTEGVVEVKSIAREPGYRTKIAVLSADPKVDPVGACVGMNGTRIKNIVRELNGEKVDIIRWDDNIHVLINNALHPAKIEDMQVYEDDRKIDIVVDEKQLPIVVGKKGHNIKLTVKLTGWKIDVKKSKDVAAAKREKDQLSDDLNIEYLQKLSEAGVSSVGDLKDITDEKAAEFLGVDLEEAHKIKEAVQKFYESAE